MGVAVGIDLGTTYSVVAYVDADGRPVVIPSLNGRATTPSVVYLGERETLVGDEAKERQAAGAQDVASFFKRHMGEPGFILEYHGRDYTPVDLSALVLGSLKQAAETYLHEPVRDAVITTPAYFTHVQRSDTVEAGRRAGLNVLVIISEPTAAALAYGFRPGLTAQRVLVYDLGGGTFDISLVDINERELRVLATSGDHHLGGRDWDDRIVTYLQREFEQEYGLELVGDDYNQLLTQAEALKRSLSTRETATVRVQAQGSVGEYTLTRAQLEEMTRDLMARTSALTEQVLAETHLTWADVTGVLPVGGSTRMPAVRAYIQQASGKEPMGGVNPDEAVGLGAAIQASLDAPTAHKPRYFLGVIRDVVAHSLGMIAESEDRSRYLNSIIVPRNIEVPATEKRPYVFPLQRNGPNRLEVFLTQGETDNPQDCAYLGLYVVTGFSGAAGSKAVVDIAYAYDKSSIVQVTAVERATGRPLTVTVEPLPPDIPARFLLAPAQVQPRRHATVYLVFDVSGSMSGTPLAKAKEAAQAFAANCDLSTTSIGLIQFSEQVQTVLRATQDANHIQRGIRDLRIGVTGAGTSGQPFTELRGLLKRGMLDTLGKLFGAGQPAQSGMTTSPGGARGLPGPGGALGGSSSESARYGVVLTDGLWEHQALAITEAQSCHRDAIEIIAIGFGDADERFLQQIASSTEQGFFTNLGGLTDVFTTIAQELTESGGDDGARVGSGLRRR
jgi:molecular chaperone DnaK